MTGVHVRRRRWRRQVRTGLAAIVATVAQTVTLPVLLVWFLAGGVWEDVQGVFGWAGDIAQRIRDVVRDAIGVVINWVSRFGDWITNWLNNLQSAFAWVGSWVNGLMDQVWGFVGNLDSYVRNQIVGWVRGIEGAVGAVAGQIANVVPTLIADALRAALGAVNNLMNWIINYVWDPLANWLGSVAGEVGNLVGRVDGFAASIGSWIDQRASDIVHALFGPVIDITNWLVHDVWPVLNKAWNWLIWLAEHPFDWPIALVRDVLGRLQRDLLGWIVQAFQNEGSVVEDWVAKWLG